MDSSPQNNPLFKRAIELQMEIDDAMKSLSSLNEPQQQIALEGTIELLLRERRRLFAIIGEMVVLNVMAGIQ